MENPPIHLFSSTTPSQKPKNSPTKIFYLTLTSVKKKNKRVLLKNLLTVSIPRTIRKGNIVK